MNASNFPTDITQDFDMSQALNIETPASYRGQAVLVSLLDAPTIHSRIAIFSQHVPSWWFSRFAPGNKIRELRFRSSSMDYIWRRIHQTQIYQMQLQSCGFSYGQTGNQAISAVLLDHRFTCTIQLPSRRNIEQWICRTNLQRSFEWQPQMGNNRLI